jgi:acyl carrier protein
MRLEALFQRGIFDEKEIRENLQLFRKTFHSKSNKFSRILDMELAEGIVEHIHFVDFFRYFAVPVSEIKTYLSEKGWVQPGDTGFCSSNCTINDVGIYLYFKEKGYHFYANQLSWDCRLGSITREQGLKEIGFQGNLQQVDNILNRIGYYHSPIKDALVMDKENEEGDKYLQAYIVSGEELTVQELREYLAKELPDYMVPSSFVLVEKVPLTSHGKVDRKALEVLGKRLALGTDYVPPRNEVESKVVETWKEVLQRDKIGIHDNYFDLGGTSFEIIRINAKLKEIFQMDIPVVSMFRYTTVRSLTQYLNNKKTEIRDRSAAFKKGKRDQMQRLQKRRGVKNG